MKYKFIVVVVISLILFSCKREKSNWNLDVVAPVVWGEFSLGDLIGDSIVVSDENNNLSIILEQELLNVTPDSLASVNDTTLNNAYTLPEGLFQVLVNPGAPIPVTTDKLVLTPGDDIELKEAIVREGSITFNMFNSLATTLVVLYELPGVTLDGQSLMIQDTLPEGIDGEPSVTTREVILDNYAMDLTGVDGISSNELVQVFTAANSLEGNQIFFFNTDTLRFELELENLSFSYARGYFGNIESSDDGDFNVEQLTDIPSNALILSEAEINMEIRNGLGVDFRISQSEYVAQNTSELLTLAIDNTALNGSINIDRAIDLGEEPEYSTKNIVLNEQNSNIVDVVALSPETFDFTFNVELNPYGNLSSSNNFLYSDHGIIINADLNIPLCLDINNLSMSDSLQFNLDGDEGSNQYVEGDLKLLFDNQFPFEIGLNVSIVDSNFVTNEELLVDGLVQSCDVNNDCNSVKSELTINLTKDHLLILEGGGYVIFKGIFNTQGEIKVKADQKLKFRAVLDAVLNSGL